MKFTDLAFTPLCRMNEVSRYSSVYQETSEKLSDHIVDVMMMSYIISTELNNKGESLNIGLLLEKCLFHDIDEVITGDIPRNTKYATPACKEELSVVASKAVDAISDMTNGSLDIRDLWETAKEGKEGLVLDISDMLSVAKKAVTEITLRGNLTFLKVVSELNDHLNNMIVKVSKVSSSLLPESVVYLTNLLIEANVEIVSILDTYSDYIDKYHIKENIINIG